MGTTTYRDEVKIGSGGFGEVWRGRNVSDDSLWAIKILKADATLEDKQRFAREVRMQSRLAHPNIARIVATALDQPQPFFVMDLAEMTFEKWCDADSPEEVVRVLVETLDALDYAHGQGIIHRDINNRNILLRRNSKSKVLHACVADFGLGLMVTRDTPTLTKTQQMMGTLAFMSPEQADDARSVDKRTDIYSLGKVLYWALTKRLPFPDFILDKVSTRFRHIVRKACEPEPEDRYQSAQEFKQALLEVVAPEAPFTPQSAEVAKWSGEAGDGSDVLSLAELAKALAGAKDDTQVLSRIVPGINPVALGRLLEMHPDQMDEVLYAYDESVSGALPLGYCDSAADFYRTLGRATKSLKHRKMILHRLLDMGHSHDRYYVRGVLGKMIEHLEDPDLIAYVAELFRKSPGSATWVTGGNSPAKWPNMIQAAIPKPERAQASLSVEAKPEAV